MLHILTTWSLAGAVSFRRPNGAYTQTLYNTGNVQYHGDFTLGGQTMQGIFDTGSFELVVRSTRCHSCLHPTPAYNRDTSLTYQANGSQVEHHYGSGSCTSVMGYEKVCVGPMCSPKQTFWEITEHNLYVLDQATFAAIIGIGPQFGYSQEKTLLMSYGVDEFSICLQRASGAHGYLTWGSIASPELQKAAFASVPSIGERQWTAAMTEVYFGAVGNERPSNQKRICGPGECNAIMDSGTSLIGAPSQHLKELLATIPHINEDCSNVQELPMLHLSLGEGHHFTLPPSAYVMRISKAQTEGLASNASFASGLQLFSLPTNRKLDTCMPAFMTMDIPSEHGMMWILGMPFFRYYHTTFNRSSKSMLFAKASPRCEPLPFMDSKATLLKQSDKEVADFDPLEVDLRAVVPPTFGFALKSNLNQKMVV